MALPKVESLKYEVNIPEINKTVKYRPLTVSEHKVLLTALEMKDEAAIINALIDIVKACTFGELDIDSLPSHIVDFLYLKIHTKSQGNISPAVYTCKNPIGVSPETGEEIVCGASYRINLDLDSAKLVYPENYEDKRVVMITDTVGMKLRVPNFSDFRKIDLKDSILAITDQFILSCIECIFDEDTVTVPGQSVSVEETIEWINGLDGRILTEVTKFFEDIPYLGLDVSVTCPKCGNKEDLVLRGLEDFFV